MFTIGHSNHSFEEFLRLLVRHGVDTLADVRSAPYSRFAPHFNREALSHALGREGVKYQYHGRELGGRPNDPDGLAQDHVKRTLRGRELGGRPNDPTGYEAGLNQLCPALVAGRVALMCAEKEPLYCHRLRVAQALDQRMVISVSAGDLQGGYRLLVTQALDQPGDRGEHVRVEHILANGDVERHQATIDRLLAKYGLEEDGGLFPRSREERVADAVALHMKRIGRKPSTDSANHK